MHIWVCVSGHVCVCECRHTEKSLGCLGDKKPLTWVLGVNTQYSVRAVGLSHFPSPLLFEKMSAVVMAAC